MMRKDDILESFALFRFGNGGGIGGLLSPETDDQVFTRVSALANGAALTLQELDQLLLLAHEASVTPGFFEYYWLEVPAHTYDVEALDGYEAWAQRRPTAILSLEHFKWGLYRLYVDALLYFGNVRTAFRQFRTMDKKGLSDFFHAKRIDTEALSARGPFLPLLPIENEHRYLTSEKASLAFGGDPDGKSELRKALLEAWHLHRQSGGGRAKFRDFLEDAGVKAGLGDRYQRTLFSAAPLLDRIVACEEEIEKQYEEIAAEYRRVRAAALRNTKLYLSMVNEMDIYVATSMREHEQFLEMASFCQEIFSDAALNRLKIRYFDPTMCAAEGYEDKGLTECLMVKCSKALVYYAGENDSYGKDAEAAMALSLGKPVIFYCNKGHRKSVYRDMHPLSRLIQFDSGVAVGGMVAESADQVKQLLIGLFENKMQYKLEQRPPGSGYLRLIELKTGSVVRVQTNDVLLTETFWNHYHGAAQAALDESRQQRA